MLRIDKKMGLGELLGRKSMIEKQEDDLEAVSLSFTKGAGMQWKSHIYCGSNVKSPMGCNKGPKPRDLNKGKQKNWTGYSENNLACVGVAG